MSYIHSGDLFANNLRRIRMERGLSQRAVANSLRVATTTVSGWELGKQPNFDALDKLAALFETSVSSLYSDGIGNRSIEAKVPLSGAYAFIDAVLCSGNTELRIMSKTNDSIVFRILQCAEAD